MRKESTKYTKDGPGTKGGQSWTPEWLKFDNSYFKEVKVQTDDDLLVLQTDDAVFADEGFRLGGSVVLLLVPPRLLLLVFQVETPLQRFEWPYSILMLLWSF